MKPAAFFDLDGTLLTVNSGALWMQRERRLGRISLWQYLQGMFFLLAYKFGVADMERVMLRALRTILGIREDVVYQWTLQWFEEEVAKYSARGAQPVIQDHRIQGHPIILLTSSSPYQAEIACKHFKLDLFLSSRYEVKDGVFTGDLIRPLCYGKGKVELAEELASRHGIDLDSSFFYTDSYTDLPMLRRVGRPCPVHPDPRLRRVAKRKGWPILDWR